MLLLPDAQPYAQARRLAGSSTWIFPYRVSSHSFAARPVMALLTDIREIPGTLAIKSCVYSSSGRSSDPLCCPLANRRHRNRATRTAVYRTVRTVVWEDGHSTNGWPPTRLFRFKTYFPLSSFFGASWLSKGCFHGLMEPLNHKVGILFGQ